MSITDFTFCEKVTSACEIHGLPKPNGHTTSKPLYIQRRNLVATLSTA